MTSIFTIIILLFSCSNSEQITEKDQAKEFCTEIVQTYFNDDCKKNYNLWNDSIKIINPYNDTIIALKDVHSNDSVWCQRFNQKQKFKDGYSYDQYLKEYKLLVFTKEEFTNIETMKKNGIDPMVAQIFNQFQSSYDSNDFFFSGTQLINENSDDQIRHWRSWQLIVSKTPNGWKITGTMP